MTLHQTYRPLHQFCPVGILDKHLKDSCSKDPTCDNKLPESSSPIKLPYHVPELPSVLLDLDLSTHFGDNMPFKLLDGSPLKPAPVHKAWMESSSRPTSWTFMNQKMINGTTDFIDPFKQRPHNHKLASSVVFGTGLSE